MGVIEDNRRLKRNLQLVKLATVADEAIERDNEPRPIDSLPIGVPGRPLRPKWGSLAYAEEHGFETLDLPNAMRLLAIIVADQAAQIEELREHLRWL